MWIQWSGPLILWFVIPKIQMLQFVKPTKLPCYFLMLLLLSYTYISYMDEVLCSSFPLCDSHSVLDSVCCPPPSVSASPSGELQPGSKVTLECQVNGISPGPIQWKTPGGKQVKGSPHAVESVALLDAGTWECMFSQGGEMQSHSLVITVKGRTLFYWSLCLLTYKSSPCGHC